MIDMRGGISFCGVDVADIGLEYAPDNASTYVFRSGNYKVNEQSFDGHDGGFFYGTTLSPKPFALRFVYQDQHINKGIIAKVNNLFRRGRTGKLVFASRPWVWYIATVTGLNTDQFTNYENGLIVVQLKAYYPFGRYDSIFCSEEEASDETILGNSALLTEAKTPSTEVVADGETLTEAKSITLYNGGTERAAVAIEIAGDVGEGILITNSTTGQSCKFVALSSAISSDAGKYVISDGISGKTVLTNGTTSELAFLYHDYGFVELEPAFPIIRDLPFSYTSGSTEVTCADGGLDGLTGKHVFLDGQWREIVSVPDSNHMNVLPAVLNTGEGTGEIVTMNKITITPVSEMSLTKLNFRYNPTFE